LRLGGPGGLGGGAGGGCSVGLSGLNQPWSKPDEPSGPAGG
jgi:hypothetical protein